MNLVLAKFRSRHSSTVAVFLAQFAVLALILIDIPIARQIIGFIYLTFFPGFIIVKLLKLGHLEVIEKVLFSIGFSVAFLMLSGLLMNEFCLLFGFSQPLSIVPLMVILGSFTLIGGILAHLRGVSFELGQIKNPRLSAIALLSAVLPILSVVGAISVNAFNENFILLFVIAAISSLLVIVIVLEKLLPSTFYSIAVLMIAISLLFHAALISKYLVSFGSDNSIELFVFRTTENNAYWDSALYAGSTAYGRFNSMLSITILPTFYSIILNINSIQVFKILFPLIFSFVSLGLYQTWRRYVGCKYAFISAFLFMAQITFYYEMLGLNREMIAELFFVLLLLVILDKKIEQPTKMVCFFTFSLGLVTSHYGLSGIFLFFISFTFIFLFAVKRSGRGITASVVVFFFTWYIYTSGSATLQTFAEFGGYVFGQLGDFFNPVSRGKTVLTGLGLETAPTVWNTISRAFAYVTEAFIVVGFVGLIMKRVKANVDREYFAISLLAMGFLAALVLVPGLANTMNMTRFYHILLFFLAPLCILGAETIGRLVSKRRTALVSSTLLLIVLVPYFFFQTGFAYEVVGAPPVSLPLSKHRMDMVLIRYIGYFDESEVVGASWMSKNVNVKSSVTYADLGSIHNILRGYGLIPIVETLFNGTIPLENSYIYLNRANIVEGKLVATPKGYSWNTTSISPSLGSANKVYSNGGCEIYKT